MNGCEVIAFTARIRPTVVFMRDGQCGHLRARHRMQSLLPTARSVSQAVTTLCVVQCAHEMRTHVQPPLCKLANPTRRIKRRWPDGVLCTMSTCHAEATTELSPSHRPSEASRMAELHRTLHVVCCTSHVACYIRCIPHAWPGGVHLARRPCSLPSRRCESGGRHQHQA